MNAAQLQQGSKESTSSKKTPPKEQNAPECATFDAQPILASTFARNRFPASAIRSNAGLIQTKLRVGPVDDAYEREADSIADQVVQRMSLQSQPSALPNALPSIQRKCAACDAEDEQIQRKPLSISNFVQAKADKGGLQASSGISSQIKASQGGGGSMSANMLSQMNQSFGRDFSHVRIHTDANAAQLNHQLNAKAFTVGNDIYFGQGQYQPNSKMGQHLLAHELVHTVQQGGNAMEIQRMVDRVEINCADNQIKFFHDATVTSYTLNNCNVTPNTYQASVSLGHNSVDFTLLEAAPETQFQFGYDIGPGQVNPNTFFAGQSSVQIVCSNTPSAGESMIYTHFNTRRLTDDDFRAMTGVDPSRIPMGQMVSLSSLQGVGSSVGRESTRALGISALTTPTPWSFMPRNVTGVLWTQGHTSIFANPASGGPSIYGYRGNLGYYMAEMLPWVGRRVTIGLHEGVPGSFANDSWFPYMYGEQHYVFQPRTQAQTEAFATRLQGTQYGGEYTYSPPRPGGGGDPILGEVRGSEARTFAELQARGRAPMCTNNCITVPESEIVDAMGSRPRTPSGVDVMSGTGPDGIANPNYAGRGRLMTEAMSEGPIAPGAGRLTITPGAGNAMFFVRGAGGILLVYGIYSSGSRIVDSVGTGRTATVVTAEAGAWTLGILGSALGTAAAAGLVCSPTGPITAVCVVGGFLGGLALGALGGMAGHAGGEALGERVVQPAVDSASSWFQQQYNYLERSIYHLYGVPRF